MLRQEFPRNMFSQRDKRRLLCASRKLEQESCATKISFQNLKINVGKDGQLVEKLKVKA
jgi:hypothetical protein